MEELTSLPPDLDPKIHGRFSGYFKEAKLNKS